jgi:tetratricopeptide (TPR) repeat protein
MRNEVEKAAALAREAISDAASEIVDILPRDGETFKKAAKMLVMAGDAKGAARVAEAHGGGELAGDILLEAGRPREAVTAYSKLNNYLKTAKALAAAGDHARALDLFRSLDAHAEAAACLEALGRFLDAGKTYFKARDYEGARRVLSKIPAGAEGHVQAEVLLKTMGERQT